MQSVTSFTMEKDVAGFIKNMAAIAVALLLMFSLQIPAWAGDTGSDKKEAATTPAPQDTKPGAAVYKESMTHGADKDVGYGAETSFLTWHGYLNFEYLDPQGKNNTFDNHEFYLSARSDVSRRVSLTAEFEYEHTPEKLILPMQAYADLKFSRAATFRVGLFYTPMGISRSYNLRGNRNRMIRQVALTHDIMFENWAEVGLNFFGETKFGLFYDVALGNGMPNTLRTGDSFFDATDDLQSHTEDNNDNKAIHSRFGYHSENFASGELNVGFSYGTQKYDPQNSKELTHTGGDLRFLHRTGWRIQAEYMARDGDNNPADLARGIAAKALGWYGQISKRFVFKNKKWIKYIEPVVQIDFIDLNRDADTNGDKQTTAFGLVFSPEPFYLLKFEYDFVKEKYGTKVDNNVFWGSVVVEF